MSEDKLQTRRAALAGFTLICLAGCSDSFNPTIQSNKDRTYTLKLERVLVGMGLRANTVLKGTPIVPSKIASALAKKWVTFGVLVESIDLDTTIDGTKSLDEAIIKFQPRQIMELSLASNTFLMGETTNISIAGSIFDAATKKRIWRSSIELRGRFDAKIYKVSPDAAAEEIANALTAKLTADGLL